MKKSATVSVSLVGAVALAIGCADAGRQSTSSSTAAQCVDQNRRVVPRENCSNTRYTNGGMYPFIWYYGGFLNGGMMHGGHYGGAVVAPGTGGYRVNAGASNLTATRASAPSTTTSRGGFGSTGSGRSAAS